MTAGADDQRATPSRRRRRTDLAMAAALGLATVTLLAATSGPIGIARDEGTYFEAAERYEGWVELLFRRPALALSDAGIAPAFGLNAEHPALVKLLSGLSHALLTGAGLSSHATGFRFPAFLFSGLLSALLYLLGASLFDRRAALLAVAAFWVTPRQFHHGHLDCFDLPVTAMWLLCAMALRRAVQPGARWRDGALAGLALGLALATKLNAFFLPVALALHLLLGPLRRALVASGPRAALRAFPRPLAFLALAPAVFFLLWPWLWHHPVERLAGYLAFHLRHVHYPWQYLGSDLREPPFPLEYVLVLTAMTVPLPLVLLQAAGAARATWLFVVHRAEAVSDDLLFLLVHAAVPLVVITNPWAPHFGGVKHWLPAMPFLCLLAAAAAVAAAESVRARLPLPVAAVRQAIFPALALLVLLPGLLGTLQSHPWGTVFYNEAVGGGAGAAKLGMQRQYWSNNVTGVLPFIDANAPLGARVWLHEVNHQSFVAYQRDGLLRRDLVEVADPSRADLVAYQYMFEFRDQEFQSWNALGTTDAAFVFAWHEAPQVTVYVRRGVTLLTGRR